MACDVLVQNFRPGILGRFGAGWPALSAVSPRLVMLSIPASVSTVMNPNGLPTRPSSTPKPA